MATPRPLRLINPATGQLRAELPVDTPATIREKVQAARSAQRDWATTSGAARVAAIRRFRAEVVQRTEPLARLLTSEMGKPVTQARSELQALLPRLDFFCDEAARSVKPETVKRDTDGGLTERITHEPLGVVANISAWNYPYFVGSNVFIPALLTGNAVVYKPSEITAQTGLAIADLLHASGIPPELFITVIGAGDAGAALLRQELDGVFFTGSLATGRRIAQAVAPRFIKHQLELGGKDPVYVCDDVDIATAAASLAEGAFYNTGQSCCSVERLYVHRRIWKSFLDAFVSAVRSYRSGDPQDEATFIGPLARGAQLELLEAQVADARSRGARVLCGGRRLRGAGHYFQPTVLTQVNHDMAVMRDETFGPVIGLMPVDDDASALRLMNDSAYGLTAGVYTPDPARAQALLAQVEAGSAYWNCCDRVSPRLPWSGVKGSGVGLTLAREGIRTFTRPKAWHLREEPS